MSWISAFNSLDLSQLDFRVRAPAPALRGTVHYYWMLRRHRDAPQVPEFLAPDGFEEIIFSYGEGYLRREISGAQVSEDFVAESYVVGCKTAGVTCARLGALNMVGIKLRPGALHELLGVPGAELGPRAVPMSDLGEPQLRELESRVFDAPDEDALVAVLDTALQKLLDDKTGEHLVDYALARIFATHGLVSIDDILKGAGCHYRTLERAFRRRVGLAPKAMARVIRFKHAFDALQRGDTGGASALDFGYYDQAHFTKEFRGFTGMTPRAFFAAGRESSIDVFRFCLELDLHELERGDVRAFSLRQPRRGPTSR